MISSPAAYPPPATRLLLTVHAFLSFVICNIDRINLSVAIIPMAEQFHWSESTKGFVQSIFFLGYMTTQIAAGALADARGGRLVLAAAVLLWSFSTAATPVAAHLALPALLLARVILGAGEGAAMPAMNALMAASVPVGQRARALSFIYSGMYAGSILGLLFSPTIIHEAGWEAVFYVYGAVGVVWVALFLGTTQSHRLSEQSVAFSRNGYSAVSRNDKAREKGVGATLEGPELEQEQSSKLAVDHMAQRDEEEGGSGKRDSMASAELGSSNPTVREMLSRKCVWAIIVAHFCCTWGYFVLLMWLPSYLYSEFHLDVKASAYLSATPWVAMFVFANLGGWLADFMIDRGMSVTRSRKVMQSIGFAGPAIFLGLMCSAKSATTAMIYVSSGLALASFSQSGVYANHQDIGPNVAGTLLGISNTFASLPGLIGVWITGVVLDVTGHNWSAVFAMAIFFYIVGLIVYNTFATSERQW